MVEHSEANGVLLELVAKVIEAGVSDMKVEYKDRREEIFAVGSEIGVAVASLDSSSEEARFLREELYAISKKKRIVHISGCAYVLRVRIFENFGEDAFHVTIKRS